MFLKHVLVGILLLGGIGAQYPVEPAEYPDGMFCTAAGTVDNAGHVLGPDHRCACHRHMDQTTDDPYCETGPMHEDNKCLQYCHYQHCRCMVHCETPKDDGQHRPIVHP